MEAQHLSQAAKISSSEENLFFQFENASFKLLIPPFDSSEGRSSITQYTFHFFVALLTRELMTKIIVNYCAHLRVREGRHTRTFILCLLTNALSRYWQVWTCKYECVRTIRRDKNKAFSFWYCAERQDLPSDLRIYWKTAGIKFNSQ